MFSPEEKGGIRTQEGLDKGMSPGEARRWGDSRTEAEKTGDNKTISKGARHSTTGSRRFVRRTPSVMPGQPARGGRQTETELRSTDRVFSPEEKGGIRTQRASTRG
ncbi:hypothetical protein NKH18_50505 [Streptomyces sp. M10(2022)]